MNEGIIQRIEMDQPQVMKETSIEINTKGIKIESDNDYIAGLLGSLVIAAIVVIIVTKRLKGK